MTSSPDSYFFSTGPDGKLDKTRCLFLEGEQTVCSLTGEVCVHVQSLSNGNGPRTKGGMVTKDGCSACREQLALQSN